MNQPHSSDLTGVTAVVTGASRGFGAGISTALVDSGAQVIGVARQPKSLHSLAAQIGARFTPVVGDAADPRTAPDLLAQYRPQVLVLNAGAVPSMAPIRDQTWESFSRNWNADTQHAFHWIGAALRLPIPPGSTVIVISSGAALRGSVLSGGYAGAKATIRFIAAYAAEESERGGLGLRIRTLLPRLTPATDLGEVGLAAYAERAGVEIEQYTDGFRPAVTPHQIGAAVVQLVSDQTVHSHSEYLITGGGMQLID